MKIEWQGHEFELLSERAVWWPERATLLVADVHFGKDAACRRSGVPVPEGGTEADCKRLARLTRALLAKRLLVLGDLIHSRLGRTEKLRATLVDWRRSLGALEIDLVRGNHDRGAGDPWDELAIRCHEEPWCFDGVDCRHEPVASGVPYLCGHLHPGISIRGAGTRPCFVAGPSRLVLPAFGDFTGSGQMEVDRGERVFPISDGTIVEVPAGLWRRGK